MIVFEYIIFSCMLSIDLLEVASNSERVISLDVVYEVDLHVLLLSLTSYNVARTLKCIIPRPVIVAKFFSHVKLLICKLTSM